MRSLRNEPPRHALGVTSMIDWRLTRPACTVLVLAFVLAATAARAASNPQDAGASAPGAQEPSPGPRSETFGRNALGVEAAVTAAVEAWNLNERREWLAGGHVAIWWAFHDRAALVMEVQALRVFQSPARAGFVQGFAPLLRWRVHRAPSWGLYAELGPGISWADTSVPPRGTRFNYLLLAGSGVTRRVGTRTEALVGFRWLHISNNGREGRSRNPDIEALGPYAGVRVSF